MIVRVDMKLRLLLTLTLRSVLPFLVLRFPLMRPVRMVVARRRLTRGDVAVRFMRLIISLRVLMLLLMLFLVWWSLLNRIGSRILMRLHRALRRCGWWELDAVVGDTNAIAAGNSMVDFESCPIFSGVVAVLPIAVLIIWPSDK